MQLETLLACVVSFVFSVLCCADCQCEQYQHKSSSYVCAHLHLRIQQANEENEKRNEMKTERHTCEQFTFIVSIQEISSDASNVWDLISFLSILLIKIKVKNVILSK